MIKKILVVDDDELTVQLLSSRLQDSGYHVVAAKDGEGALRQAVSEKPDVVIMDIMLPDMQGSDAVKIFQENSDISDNLRVIFLSGIISQADVEDQKIQIGEKYYPAIAKPVDFSRLLALLSEES